MDGKKTQGENIADNSGLKSAYYAYTERIDRNKPEPHLPAFRQYTSKQMFWISAAQTWCSLDGDLYTRISMLERDVHSPNRFRVIGPMRNIKEFGMDFKCAPGTPMNPIEKCEMW